MSIAQRALFPEIVARNPDGCGCLCSRVYDNYPEVSHVQA